MLWGHILLVISGSPEYNTLTEQGDRYGDTVIFPRGHHGRPWRQMGSEGVSAAEGIRGEDPWQHIPRSENKMVDMAVDSQRFWSDWASSRQLRTFIQTQILYRSLPSNERVQIT